MITAIIVSCSLATSCPDPLPPMPPEPEEDTLSPARILFESFSVSGLYFDGKAVVKYNPDTFQKAMKTDGTLFRIQRDDQIEYMNVEQANFAATTYNVIYKSEDGDQTLLILNAKIIKRKDGKRWLWNESRRIGIITE